MSSLSRDVRVGLRWRRSCKREVSRGRGAQGSETGVFRSSRSSRSLRRLLELAGWTVHGSRGVSQSPTESHAASRAAQIVTEFQGVLWGFTEQRDPRSVAEDALP
eukprot:gene18269-biopygen20434